MDKQQIEQRLISLLSRHDLSVATAESCTGGLVSAALCEIPGISAYFEEGYITYSENAKMKNLGVSSDTLRKYGVVSTQTAMEMAQGAAQRAKAKCAIATTGVAGPAGGTKETPVGTVYIACVVNEYTYVECMHFQGNRNQIRMQAADYAIEMLCDYIEAYFELKE